MCVCMCDSCGVCLVCACVEDEYVSVCASVSRMVGSVDG